MLSDKVNPASAWGHRKPYILLGLLIQILCLILVAFVDPAKYYWGFVAIAFILQMGMALYDTCTDGLALDTIPEDEQGTIQSFMVGGARRRRDRYRLGSRPAGGKSLLDFCLLTVSRLHSRAHSDGAESQGSRAPGGTQSSIGRLFPPSNKKPSSPWQRWDLFSS